MIATHPKTGRSPPIPDRILAAVCGGWWDGPCHQFSPCYALVDLFDDGTTACRLIPYGPTPEG